VQPAALVAKVPNTITPTKGIGGVPALAKNTAHKAGIIKMRRPEGLSHLNSCIIDSSVDSASGLDWLNMTNLDFRLGKWILAYLIH
jgi:hypothetical protein